MLKSGFARGVELRLVTLSTVSPLPVTSTQNRKDRLRGSVISSGTITLSVISFLSRNSRISSTQPGFAVAHGARDVVTL